MHVGAIAVGAFCTIFGTGLCMCNAGDVTVEVCYETYHKYLYIQPTKAYSGAVEENVQIENQRFQLSLQISRVFSFQVMSWK